MPCDAYRAPVDTLARQWEPVPWLMRSWRHAAPDPALRVQPQLIDAMKAYPGVPKSLVPGTLTRYEKGQFTPPLPIVSALEQIVGLTAGEISSYLPDDKYDTTSRSDQWDLLGRADTADVAPLSGRDWLALARLITTGPPQSPERTSFWAHLLVSEMSRSIGAGYRFRIRALELLAADPVIAGPVEDAVRDHLAACGHTVIGDALAALTDVQHPHGFLLALDTYRQLDGSALEAVAYVLAVDLRRDRDRLDQWDQIKRVVRDDVTSGADDRRLAALIVAGSFQPLRLYELLMPLSEAQRKLIRSSIANSRSKTLSLADARAMRKDAAKLARGVAAGVTPRLPDGLGVWLERLLIDGADPFTAALVIASSPYSHAVSHAVEASVLSPKAAGPLGTGCPFPYAPVALGSCQRQDPETLAAAYRDGAVADKQRLLVPLAHHRAFPAEIDLTTAIRETGSPSRVIYAAGMSDHPGLVELDGADISTDLKRAAQWWSEGPNQHAMDR
ncbi:hypothetical protein [Flexivirga alba]|uniref:XRE family transcriptional regulator n=1 Tax=Flexivirga alba TaxID=702742 RepID=A0ABW2AE45_9MICO